MTPHTSYLISGTNRTGSFLLCEALLNTGLAGHPVGETFSASNEPQNYKRWNVTNYRDYFHSALQQGTTENGVFGAKMMIDYFPDFVEKMRQLEEYGDENLQSYEVMDRVFPNLHYIWITRRDKVRQAVSYLRALQTRIWGWNQSDSAPTPERDPEYSYEKIDLLLQQYVIYEATWQDYFREANITPFVVVYEDLCLKYEETAIQILEYLNVPVPPDLQFGPRRMAQQADHITEEWVEKFKSRKAKELESWTGPWPSGPEK